MGERPDALHGVWSWGTAAMHTAQDNESSHDVTPRAENVERLRPRLWGATRGPAGTSRAFAGSRETRVPPELSSSLAYTI